jgi:alpha-L-fucosidase
MKNKLIPLTLMTCGLLAGAFSAFGQDAAPNPSDLRYGLLIQYSVETFANPGEQGQIPAERFVPTNLDAKAWAHAAKAAGMTFAVLTAKHTSGFCLWNSDGYSYGVSQSPFKGDIIGDFIAACKAEGIVPGVHYSIIDSYNEGAVRGKSLVSPVYFAQIIKHLTELHTRYPDIRIQILDGTGKLTPEQLQDVCQLIKKLNPACLLLVKVKQPQGTGRHFEDASVMNNWMWKPQAQLSPVQNLFDDYSQARQANHIFILGVGPEPSGRIPDDQIAELMQMKDMIATRPLTPPPAATSPAAQPSAADRLKQVKDLYDQGLINKDDYDKKVKEILGSM